MLGNREIMGENIMRHMDEHNLSRIEFAKAINEPYSSVTDWINGKSYPRIDKIQKMADFFGVEKADLVEKYKPDQPTISLFDARILSAFHSASEETKRNICFMLKVPFEEGNAL